MPSSVTVRMKSKACSSWMKIVILVLSFFSTSAIYAQNVADLPEAGSRISLSSPYESTIMSGMTIHPENPFRFEFIIDSGDDNLKSEDLEKVTKKLINYFLATLTVPENELWVNLSPYEKDRIVADGLGATEMGRDMLVQDYMLKQLTASLMYPEEGVGSEFWKRIHEKTQAKFGVTNIPTNTFNKIWIVPENAIVYVSGNNVFVSKSHLKVMLEEDYLAMESNIDSTTHGLGELTKNDIEHVSKEAKEAIREILIPEIEREVNEGKNFANLRQIYNSMILATWYKKNLKESVLGNVYINTNKVTGIDLKDKQMKERIYNQYVEAFEKGVYDYIREDYDPATQEIIPRKYFSGGLRGHTIETIDEGAEDAREPVRRDFADENREYTALLELDMTDENGTVINPEQPDKQTRVGGDNERLVELETMRNMLKDELVNLHLEQQGDNFVAYVWGMSDRELSKLTYEMSSYDEGLRIIKYAAEENLFHQLGRLIRVVGLERQGFVPFKNDGDIRFPDKQRPYFRIEFEDRGPAQITYEEMVYQDALAEAKRKGYNPDIIVRSEYNHENRGQMRPRQVTDRLLAEAWKSPRKAQDKVDVGVGSSPVVMTHELVKNPGGIDLNPNELNLSEQGETINFKMDNTMLQTLRPNSVQGITPVLINITPITNFAPLLGLSDEQELDNQQLSRLQ